MTIQHLYFLRHAEGLHNVREPHGPLAEVPLTEQGLQSVSTIADKISQANFIHPPEVILVSPLVRTVQTAEGLKPLYPHVSFKMDPMLIEWTPFDIAPGTVMTYAEKEPLIAGMWQQADPHWIGTPGCESFHDCLARTKQLTQQLFNDTRDSIICVSHGHFVQTFVLNLLEDTQPTAAAMEQSRGFQRLGNLDIVHVARDRETGHIVIAQHKYKENYLQAHNYPVERVRTVKDEVQLM